jgi:hypothetical protein
MSPVLGAGLPEAAAWLHDTSYASRPHRDWAARTGRRYLRDAQHADALLAGQSHTTPAPSSKPTNADSPTS